MDINEMRAALRAVRQLDGNIPLAVVVAPDHLISQRLNKH